MSVCTTASRSTDSRQAKVEQNAFYGYKNNKFWEEFVYLTYRSYLFEAHQPNVNRITNLTDNRIHMSVQKKKSKEHVDRMSSDRIPKNDFKIPTKRENKFRMTFEKMEGFSFVTPVTGLNRPKTGKEDDDDQPNLTELNLSELTLTSFTSNLT
jgi:hypothetical protein